jgi:acrylyl-CoA reductase (NADPH)
MTFRAIVIDRTDAGQAVSFRDLEESDLMDGDVTVRVDHSTVNYKDGLALTGKAPVIRRYPMIPGVDFAGTVVHSDNPEFAAGDKVILNGCGVGELHYGGYAGMARVSGDWLVPLPAALSTADAMVIGTAGFTAMLCVLALSGQGVEPSDGDILVTGAAGGVGSMAVSILSKLGYRVVASTGRRFEEPYLRKLGAAEVVDRAEFATPVKPLAKMRWAGAIDSVGSLTLANVLSQVKYGGAVAACGLAQGSDLPATVMPFILRAVRLIGCDSVNTPRADRRNAWRRLAEVLEPAKLDAMGTHVKLEDVPRVAGDIVAGQVRGRVVVDL